MMHLSKSTRRVLESDNKTKIDHVYNNQWIAYPSANLALQKMEKILSRPKTHRPDSMLLVGESNSGKTMILRKFQKNNPSYYFKGEDHFRSPVVSINAPFKPSVADFFLRILEAVNYPQRPSTSVATRQYRVYHTLKSLKTEVLVIDEIHNIFSGGAKTIEFLNCLRALSNDLNLSIICAGTEKAFRVTTSDDQSANRFLTVELGRWRFDEDYLRLLTSIESLLPLPEPSKLIEREIAMEILRQSEGLIGEVITLLRRSFEFCLDNDLNSISLDVIKNTEWIRPSMRRNQKILI